MKTFLEICKQVNAAVSHQSFLEGSEPEKVDYRVMVEIYLKYKLTQ